jgi:hypothetical protein
MKTIRLYHPHTHEGIAYDPPPEGIELSVNDADAAVLEAWGLTRPPPALADASTTAPVADAPLTDAVNDAVPSRHDRRARVAVDLSSTEPAADTTARSV